MILTQIFGSWGKFPNHQTKLASDSWMRLGLCSTKHVQSLATWQLAVNSVNWEKMSNDRRKLRLWKGFLTNTIINVYRYVYWFCIHKISILIWKEIIVRETFDVLPIKIRIFSETPTCTCNRRLMNGINPRDVTPLFWYKMFYSDHK